jgi:hypothetical protein
MSSPIQPPLAKMKTCRRCDSAFPVPVMNPRSYVCQACKQSAHEKANTRWREGYRIGKVKMSDLRSQVELLRLDIEVLKRLIAGSCK